MTMRPDTFFEVLFPMLLEATDRVGTEPNLWVSMCVTGSNGGRWQFRLGRGPKPRQLEVTLAYPTFVEWIEGRLDAGAALQSSKLQIQGRIDDLMALSRALAGDRSRPSGGESFGWVSIPLAG